MPSPKDRQPEQTGQRDAHGRFLPGNHNGGRPKEYRAFKERCAEFMDAEGFALLKDLARQPNEFALKLLAEYAYGKPQQYVDLTTKGEPFKVYVGIDTDRV